MKDLVILSGAGISAESGIKTFRDADGLWEGHDIMEVASPLMAGKRTRKRCWIFTTKGADSFLKFILTKLMRF
ncbi:hypothetical protein HpEKA39_12840 [Helicobacter pylori]